MRAYCSFCPRIVNPHDTGIYSEVTSWVTGPKQDRPILREKTGRVACRPCMEALRNGQPPGQPTLFDHMELVAREDGPNIWRHCDDDTPCLNYPRAVWVYSYRFTEEVEPCQRHGHYLVMEDASHGDAGWAEGGGTVALAGQTYFDYFSYVRGLTNGHRGRGQEEVWPRARRLRVPRL